MTPDTAANDELDDLEPAARERVARALAALREHRKTVKGCDDDA